MKKEKIKVMADNFNGVFQVKSFEDYDGCEVLNPADFWECLSDFSHEMEKNSSLILQEWIERIEKNSSLIFQNKTIGAELNKKWFKKIADEYGIQQNFSG